MKSIFTHEEIEYIVDNYQNKTYKQITAEINTFNEIKKNEKQVRTKASQLGLSKLKYEYNRRYFNKIDTHEKAYWLGFMFADGYIQKRKYKNGRTSSELGIEIAKCDEKHLVKFIDAINGNIKITNRLTKDRVIKGVLTKGGTCMSLVRLHSVEMVDDLIDKNFVPNKTYRNEFPKVSKLLFWSFLRGVVDGDGHVYPKTGTLKITNSNKLFLEYLQENLDQYDFESYIRKEEEWKYILHLKHSYKSLLDNMYKDATVFLDRKYNIYKKIMA